VESDPVGLLLGGINTYAYAYGNSLRYPDPRGTDVRIQNGSQVGGLHQSISVDTPNGPYAISFGEDRGGVAGSSQSATGMDPVANGVEVESYMRIRFRRCRSRTYFRRRPNGIE